MRKMAKLETLKQKNAILKNELLRVCLKKKKTNTKNEQKLSKQTANRINNSAFELNTRK